MRKDIEDYFLNPPPGSAAERAAAFGIDLTLTLQNLRLTPEERIRKLDDHIAGIAKLKATARIMGRGEQPSSAGPRQLWPTAWLRA